ncbi:hypothetical protein [uncultured Akkermansia sp.]|uniref:hypothetical protein n=1 Tax=uncultured Akkermansia sp. TaxID=512294 RepID=UPI00261D8977|nr:hypothetical protein [uncultured Akkermansia sp.]
MAHKVKINDAIFFVRIRKTVSILFHKTPEKAFPGNRETRINRRLENTHGAASPEQPRLLFPLLKNAENPDMQKTAVPLHGGL